MRTTFTELETPVGRLTLAATDRGLTGIWFPSSRHGPPPGERGEWVPDDGRGGAGEVLARTRVQLEEYFSAPGARTRFDLPLAPSGTEFQLKVWEALRAIPFGSTVSYLDLARRLGDPGATRAVGAANGRNPIPIVVPCHRVIGANGDLTGFGGGIERKRWLLEHEGALLRLLAVLALSLFASGASAQTRPAPAADSAVASAPRPLPGPVYESAAFSRAVARGTRTRTGEPGPKYWVQHPRYAIDATLDPARNRVSGVETAVYVNHSPDSLRRIAIYLRQNVFAPGSPRRDPVPVTGGITLGRITVNGREVPAAPPPNPAKPVTAPPRRGPAAGEYTVDGTVMWIALAQPLLPGDSLTLGAAWSYGPAPAPADGREGREGGVVFMGYWYPQFAVYDDVDGWVTDPYLLQAEFYMDPADYDVRLTVPRGWVVGATGTLENPGAVLSAAARDSLARARATGRVVRVLTPGPGAARVLAGAGPTATWRFRAADVRDFAWGASDEYAWDATRAIIAKADGSPDTVDISSFFRLSEAAAAWRAGGARFTRDAIVQMSAYLWPYPYPQMTSMEGVLSSGGMEYPMMTLMQPWADTLSLAGDLMHETGHMWFPMQVGSNETRYPWMDEGFTQFDVAQGMRVLYGEPRRGGRPNDSETGQRAEYLRTVRAGREAPLMISGTGDDYPDDLYFLMYYDKTAQALAALRGILGADLFHRAFADYGRRWVDRHPEPADFFNAISRAAGRDLSWFWSTWFYHAWPLDQAIDSVTAAGDSLTIAVSDRGLAPMPVRLAVTRADGTVQRLEIPVEVWLSGARRTVVRVAGAPAVTRVEIDPEGFFPDLDRANQVWPRDGTRP
ncbi:MAG TPA: methylated-DNA--[protein]-cysteine S-methyltransferase [Gemmatimonadales bacterium]|nr:methylated-DNA--[protein]-cysteine S-methyltransferase [Gemmatimonadales bacterium]